MRKLFLLLLLAATPALAQYARYDYYLTNAQGQAISGAQVFVLDQPANTAALSPQQQLYGSATGTGAANCGGSGGALTQPILTDGFGHACMYANPGIYTVISISPTTGTITLQDQTFPGNTTGTIPVRVFGALCNWNPATQIGADDTLAFQAAAAAAIAEAGPMGLPPIILPAGNCRVTTGLSGSQSYQGQGSTATTLTLTAPVASSATSAALLTVTPANLNNGSINASFTGQPTIKNLTLSGNGALTTGTLLEIDGVQNGRTEDLNFTLTGGVGLSLQGSTERWHFDDTLMTGVRWPIISGLSGNEAYFTNLRLMFDGRTYATGAGTGNVVCYSVNCVGNSYPASGALYPDSHYLITIAGADNMQFDGGSLKDLTYMGGLQFFNGGVVSANNLYFELGYDNNSVAVGGIAPGVQFTAPLGTVPGSFSVASSQWFPVNFSQQAALNLYGGPLTAVIHAPDYVPGSTSPSAALCCGITKGQFEYVSVNGCANDSGQCTISARAQNSTTAVNWPANAVMELYSFTPTLNLTATHQVGNGNPSAPAGYTYQTDASGCNSSAEIISGNQPCNNYGNAVFSGYNNWNTFVQPLQNAGQVALNLKDLLTFNSLQTGANYPQGSILVHNYATVNLQDAVIDNTTETFSRPYKVQWGNYGGAFILGAIYPNGQQASFTINDPANQRVLGSTNIPGQGQYFQQRSITFNSDGSSTPTLDTDSSFAISDGSPQTPMPTLVPTTGGSLAPGTYWVRQSWGQLGIGPGNCKECGTQPSQASQITITNPGSGYGATTATVANCTGVGWANIGNGIDGPIGTVVDFLFPNGGLCSATGPQTITLTNVAGGTGSGFAGTLTPIPQTFTAPTPSKAIIIASPYNAITVSAPNADPFGAASGYFVWAALQEGQELLQTTTLQSPVTSSFTFGSLLTNTTPVPYPECQSGCTPINKWTFKGYPNNGATSGLYNTVFNPYTGVTATPYSFTPTLATVPGLNLGGTTAVLEANGSAGTSGQCFLSAGPGVTPTWGACPSAGGGVTAGFFTGDGIFTASSQTVTNSSGTLTWSTAVAQQTAKCLFGNYTSTGSPTSPSCSTTPALPNGTTATTQTTADTTTDVATDAFVHNAITAAGVGFTLTTSGTSGAATYTSGVLNIPNYSGLGAGNYYPCQGTGTPINGVFCVDNFPTSCTVNAVAYTTQWDCANATAIAYVNSAGKSALLWLGLGIYPACAAQTEPMLANGATVSIRGQMMGPIITRPTAFTVPSPVSGAGFTGSIIQTACAMAQPLLIWSDTSHQAGAIISDFSIDNSSGLAQGCLTLAGASGTYMYNFRCSDQSYGAWGSLYWGNNLLTNGYTADLVTSNINVNRTSTYSASSQAINNKLMASTGSNVGIVNGSVVCTGTSCVFPVQTMATSFTAGNTVTFGDAGSKESPAFLLPATPQSGGVTGTVTGTPTSSSFTATVAGASSGTYTNVNTLASAAASNGPLTSIQVVPNLVATGKATSDTQVFFLGWNTASNLNTPCTGTPTASVTIPSGAIVYGNPHSGAGGTNYYKNDVIAFVQGANRATNLTNYSISGTSVTFTVPTMATAFALTTVTFGAGTTTSPALNIAVASNSYTVTASTATSFTVTIPGLTTTGTGTATGSAYTNNISTLTVNSIVGGGNGPGAVASFSPGSLASTATGYSGTSYISDLTYATRGTVGTPLAVIDITHPTASGLTVDALAYGVPTVTVTGNGGSCDPVHTYPQIRVPPIGIAALMADSVSDSHFFSTETEGAVSQCQVQNNHHGGNKFYGIHPIGSGGSACGISDPWGGNEFYSISCDTNSGPCFVASNTGKNYDFIYGLSYYWNHSNAPFQGADGIVVGSLTNTYLQLHGQICSDSGVQNEGGFVNFFGPNGPVTNTQLGSLTEIGGNNCSTTSPYQGENTLYGTQGTTTTCVAHSTPEQCAAASSGLVFVATGGTTATINTTAVTNNSQITLNFDSTLGTAMSQTCNTTFNQLSVTNRVPGVSFTVTAASTVTTNPVCFSYSITN